MRKLYRENPMNELTLPNGSPIIVRDDQRLRIERAESDLARAAVARDTLRKEIAKIELKLRETSPDFRKIEKLKGKLKLLDSLRRESEIVLSREFNDIYKASASGKSAADMFAEALPDEPVGRRKRGAVRRGR